METISKQEFIKRYGNSAVEEFNKKPIEDSYFGKAKPEIKGSLLERIKGAFNERNQNVLEGKQLAREGKQSVGSSLYQAVGQSAGLIGDVGFETLKAITPDVVEEKVSNVVGGAVQKLGETDTAQSLMEGYNKWKENNPEAARNLESTINIASLIPVGAGVGVGAKATTKAIGKTIDVGADIGKKGIKAGIDGAENIKNSLIKLASPDADDATKTILKESTPDDVDLFVKIQEKASVDPRAITPFEYVGDRLSEALKKLNQIKSEVGAKKSEIVKPLRAGLDKFETSEFVNDLISLKNRLSTSSDKSFVQGVIDKARQSKTIGAVDKLIDDVQDLIYTSGANKTLPKGSALEKQMRGILSKLNGKLKESLPPEYSSLNTKYANLQKATDAINRALGESVEGVSVRGGSLIKQFFSPSGRNAKVLFDYVKKNTGIDLAKDAVLAKYIMDLFEDPRARSLLGGKIPTSVSGAIDKSIDFVVEKTGVGKKIQGELRKGAIEKAKKLTKGKKKKTK